MRLIISTWLAAACLGATGLTHAQSTLPVDLTNAAIWNYMKTNDYASWALVPGTTVDHFDPPTSHDTYLTVRINDTGSKYLMEKFPFEFQPYKDAQGSNFLRLPEGALLYKVASLKLGGPASAGLAVMYKVPAEQLASCAFPLCQNGWLFTFFDAPPKPGNMGRYTGGQSCVACHTGAYSAAASGAELYNESAKYMLSEADYV